MLLNEYNYKLDMNMRFKEGFSDGYSSGEKAGQIIGMQQGMQQGEKQKAIALALKYMAIGHSIEEAAAFAEVSITDLVQNK